MCELQELCRASLSKLWTSLWRSTKAESPQDPHQILQLSGVAQHQSESTRDLGSYSHLPWQSAIREANLLLMKKCRLLNSASNWMLHPCWSASDTFPTANVREKIGTGRASHSRLLFFSFFFFYELFATAGGREKTPKKFGFRSKSRRIHEKVSTNNNNRKREKGCMSVWCTIHFTLSVFSI